MDNEHIILGSTEEYFIQYESFGKHLFHCLKKRKSNEVIAIDAFTKEELTCGQLLEQSIKLSVALKEMSIQKGDVIALISENTLLYYTAVCASMFCGAQLNLLNPTYTTGELNHVFTISKPKLVISSKAALQNVLAVKEEFNCIQAIILLDKESIVDTQNVEELMQGVESVDGFQPVEAKVTDTAFLCLSSGTTGLPKCVELSHGNLMPILNQSYDSRHLNIREHDTTVLILPFFHIYGLVVHMLGVTNSLKVVLMKSFKPDLYLEAIENYKATLIFIVPPILLFLTRHPMVSKYNITSIKRVIIGAAPLTDEVYEEALQKFSHSTIQQLYGSTEAGGMCTLQDSTDTFLTIGKVVYNGAIKIASTDTNATLGPNEVGEICFKSMSVMKGYLNNPSETKNSFDNDGFYHTGDVGYYDKNKNFYIVGRIKELIKYKGFQVAPAEIENILATHPGIQDCGVVGVQDQRCGEKPLAFVVLRAGSEVTEEELVAFVADRISVQKQLHGGVRFVEQIPRNLSGKILRKELVKLLDKK